MNEHYDVSNMGSEPGRAAALSPTTSPRRASASCCSSAATGCPAKPANSVDAGGAPAEGRYIPPDQWYDVKGKSFFQPQVHYFVGGATKLYGAALYRMRAEDFGEIRHHDGLSPAWPISYQDMEPYYTAAEAMYQVHGARGEDPTEPPASAPYPYPAVSHEPRIQPSCPTTWKKGDTTRSTRRAASWSTRRTRPTASACAARTATASRARCTPSPTPRCSASAPLLSIPT